jgi:N-acetylneuraminic acid mutarotase
LQKTDSIFKILAKKELTPPSKACGDVNPPESRKDSSPSNNDSFYKARSLINTPKTLHYSKHSVHNSISQGSNQYIFVFSGIQKNMLLSCEKYNTGQDKWEECKPISKPRTKFAAASILNNKILIIGGKAGNSQCTDDICMYDPILDTWSVSPYRLPKGIYSFGSYSDGLGIYVCGGSDGATINTLQYLDYNSKEWKGLANMIQKREDLGLVYGNDKKLYAIGGYNGKECLKTVEKYDIISKKWELAASMNVARSCHGSVELADGIYAIGGCDGTSVLSSCEKYVAN